MSYTIKRVLHDSTNETKSLKHDSAIDLSFDIGGLKYEQSQSSYSIAISSESSIENDSVLDNDAFETERCLITSLSKANRNRGRPRLNGISAYQTKENKIEYKGQYVKTEQNIMNETLNKLREEQARIEAHSLSITAK